RYFLDNQTAEGLVLDRQANHGPLHDGGLCSTAATGMGWIALALASADPYRLLGRAEAVVRLRLGMDVALHWLPHTEGVLPPFSQGAARPVGVDARSTVDTGWLVAGALWAAAFLGDATLESLAARLYKRIDWAYWTAPDVPGFTGLLRHGQDARGRFLRC